MHVLQLNGHMVDVLEIQNDHRGPFFLENDYPRVPANTRQSRNSPSPSPARTVKAGFIYTRNGSMNTSISSNADYGQIEELWKKRFGLLLPPLQRFNMLVRERGDWVFENGTFYHRIRPEFTIQLEEDRGPTFPLFFAYMDSDPGAAKYFNVHSKFYGTTLGSLQAIQYDCGRYMAVVPGPGIITLSGQVVRFSCFTREMPAYDIHLLLKGLSQHSVADHHFSSCVPLFGSEDEQFAFTSYVASHESDFLQLVADFSHTFQHVQGLNNDTAAIQEQLRQGKALVRMHRHNFANIP